MRAQRGDDERVLHHDTRVMREGWTTTTNMYIHTTNPPEYLARRKTRAYMHMTTVTLPGDANAATR